LDYLDATRAFALVLGVVFHSSLSFTPLFIGWAVQDVSTSPLIAMLMAIVHSFRMETFFLIAGFLSRPAFHRKGLAGFARSRALRVLAPFAAGWFILRPLLVSGWIMGSASLRGKVNVWDGFLGGFQSLSTLPAGIFTGTHLWFLYYLAMVTAFALALRGLLSATGGWNLRIIALTDALVAWLANSRVSIPILALPAAGALWFMDSWGMDTPDRSLRPHWPALAIYGGFFALGWMLSRQRALVAPFARLAPERWALAGLGVAGVLLLGDIERDPANPHYLAAHATYALSYELSMWSLVFLTIGLFKRFCFKPNNLVRYLADSSYWMYLVHLPLVVWLQVAVAEVPAHWSLKLAFVSFAAIAISLLAYDLFVRSTFLGAWLNGQRRGRALSAVARKLAASVRRGKPSEAWSRAAEKPAAP
jgi:surface polysaccharide O-acyltransferase-like enzyme